MAISYYRRRAGYSLLIELYESEAALREFARIYYKLASEAELLREALRHLEQYCDDREQGGKLVLEKADGTSTMMAARLFNDPVTPSKTRFIVKLKSDEAFKLRLDQLTQRMKLRDCSELFRFALRLYARMAREEKTGGTFWVQYSRIRRRAYGCAVGSQVKQRLPVVSQLIFNLIPRLLPGKDAAFEIVDFEIRH